MSNLSPAHATAQRAAPLLLVSGPTACGKSALALALAQRLRGEILNLDSMQVYRGCNIGTAKPDQQQQAVVAHHLFDIVDPSQQMDAGRFIELAKLKIAELEARQVLPIFVGGSSMYLSLLLSGLANLPKTDPGLRQELQQLSSQQAYAQLQQRDAQRAAQLHPADRVRVLRALEVLRAPQGMGADQNISSVYAQQACQPQPYCGLCLVLCWPREELYARIQQRCEQMLEQGLIEEVRTLQATWGDAARHTLRSVGYAQVCDYLAGTLPEELLLEEICKQTRRYAKRQMTFWRNEPAKRHWQAFPEDEHTGILLGLNPAAKASRGVYAFSYDFQELRLRVQQRLGEAFSGTEVWYLDARRVITALPLAATPGLELPEL